jgi:ABC-type cobalamin/Fe3+-siderophores transport system ATPase subunit
MEPPPEVRVRDWLRLAGALAPRRPGPSLAPQLPPDRALGALSTGERKRLVLQALLDRRAGAYVLDEPFEHLSSDAALTLAARLEAMARNAVVVVATHRELTIAGDGARGAAVLRLLGGGSWHLEEAPRPDPS